MKTTRWSLGAVFLTTILVNAVQALPPRRDINPAILYLNAFAAFPELDDAEQQLVASPASGDITADERSLAERFDPAFRHIHHARHCTVPADWGTDNADGPNALIADFKKVRLAVQAGLLRARIALADGEQGRARDELLAISALARNGASGTSLVGTMIQVATESKLLDFISEHYDEFKPGTRAELAAGLRAGPRRVSVTDAMVNEKAAFCDWLAGWIESAQRELKDDARVLEAFRQLIAETLKNDDDLAERMIERAGGTVAGLLESIRAVDRYYAHAQAVARAPADEIKRVSAEFDAALNRATNVVALAVIPNVSKARLRELEFQARLDEFLKRAW